MHRKAVAALVAALLVGRAAPALADATLFIGANTTPANRVVRGGAIGIGLVIVAFEFEYANTAQNELAGAPSLRTGSGNILLQAPVHFFGFQPYYTVGAGIYRERLGTHATTGVAPQTGGGVKISLAGPLQLRLDYRVIKLGRGALFSPAHRVYAGLNLKF